MAVRITLDNPIPLALPADGWLVGYKPLGNPGAYITVGPFVALPIEIDTADPVGTLYEGYITRDCGAEVSAPFFWETACNCTDINFTPNIDGDECIDEQSQAATVTNSGFCLAASQDGAYTNYGARIYNPSFIDANLFILDEVADPSIFIYLNTPGQWSNPTASVSVGPMNREGVWIDSDCNGTKNALGVGVETTLAYLYNNVGPTKIIHVGVGGDNQFRVVVNGVIIADTGATISDLQFKIWHIIPITVTPGANLINVVATGDGSVNDAVAMVVYDNTAAQIAAATTDLDLNIPFASSSLRGTSYDVATCPAGWSLDVSGGAGNYVCRRTLTMSCNTL